LLLNYYGLKLLKFLQNIPFEKLSKKSPKTNAMRFRNRKSKSGEQSKLSVKSEELNSNETEIERILNETINLIEKSDHISVFKLKSFKQFEKCVKQNSDRSKCLKTFERLFSYWDIILLLFLNILFATYLCYFFSVYYSPSSQIDIVNTFTKIKNWLIAQWLYYDGFTDLTKENCAFVAPEITSVMFRPINDCSMCMNLKEIKRVENITKEQFLNEYAYTGVPVVITGAISNWTALKVLNFNFLKELYTKREEKFIRNEPNMNTMENVFNSIVTKRDDVVQEKDVCQFFPYKTSFRDLSEVFEMEMNEENEWTHPWYVGWSNCNGRVAQILRKHYEKPYFLPDDSEMSRLDWIFLGTPGYGANIHIDDVDIPSWQAQISGIKHWRCKFAHNVS
jgi:histone arginine demethylase JMJD6